MKTFLLIALTGAAIALRGSAAQLPSHALTPGATLKVSKAKICVPGYSKSVRNVSSETKRQVFIEYGITKHKPGEYEIDHSISLELGGSNDIENLWPQRYTGDWNAHDKDKLENALHALVCSGDLGLSEAQTAIANDWIAEYKKVFGE